MRYTIPDYYRQFQCAAGQCEDTCCAGWQIQIDERSLGRYARLKGRAGRKLRRSIRWRQRIFRQKEGKRCVFLNQDNLCDMYTELGEKSLCRTCRLYPRHIEEFEGIREITMSLSCPVVARLLMNREEPAAFPACEKDGEEEYEEFDLLLYSALADAREVILDILQNRAVPAQAREQRMLALADEVEKNYLEGALFSCQELFDAPGRAEAAGKPGGAENNEARMGRRFCFMKKMFAFLDTLELLREDWKSCLDETRALLYSEADAGYAATCLEFGAWMKRYMPMWEIQSEQILVYFISVYFCGAVYDGRISAKAKLAAVSRMIIEEMLMARWIKNEKTLDTEDIVETVYRYAREVEHSDKNVNRLESLMEKVPSNLTSYVSGFVPPCTV